MCRCRKDFFCIFKCFGSEFISLKVETGRVVTKRIEKCKENQNTHHSDE